MFQVHFSQDLGSDLNVPATLSCRVPRPNSKTKTYEMHIGSLTGLRGSIVGFQQQGFDGEAYPSFVDIDAERRAGSRQFIAPEETKKQPRHPRILLSLRTLRQPLPNRPLHQRRIHLPRLVEAWTHESNDDAAILERALGIFAGDVLPVPGVDEEGRSGAAEEGAQHHFVVREVFVQFDVFVQVLVGLADPQPFDRVEGAFAGFGAVAKDANDCWVSLAMFYLVS